LNAEPLLQLHAIAIGRERDRVEAVAGFEAWISRRLATFDTSEKSIKLVDRLPPTLPSIAPLVKRGVVKVTRPVKKRVEDTSLRLGGIEPVFECPTHDGLLYTTDTVLKQEGGAASAAA